MTLLVLEVEEGFRLLISRITDSLSGSSAAAALLVSSY